MTLSQKLKTARELFGDTQSIASQKSGVAQRDISYLEAGKKKYLPTEYILYLQKNGIDLNTLFDETKELAIIEKNFMKEMISKQKHLEEKEEMIRLLRDAVELRDKKINELKNNILEKSKKSLARI